MSLLSAMNAGHSGVRAFGQALQGHANNLANLSTDGFKADRVTLSAAAGGGVAATFAKDPSPGPQVQRQQSAGAANVELSNVDIADQMVGLVGVEAGYKANLKTIATADQMLGTLLDIKA